MSRIGLWAHGALLTAATGFLLWAPSAGAGTTLGTAGGQTYVKATATGVTSQAGAETSCPSNETATGGGGAISGKGANATLNSSYPLSEGAGWKAEGSTSGTRPRLVTSFGVCSGAGASTTLGSQTALPPGASISSVEYCGSGEVTTGGGFRAEGGNVSIIATVPYSTPGYDPYWANAAMNRGTASATVSDFVNCIASADLTTRTSSQRLRRDRTGRAIARCKRGEAVTGGGLAPVLSGLQAGDASALSTRPWDSRADANQVPEDGWLARAHNFGPRVDLTAYAICKKEFFVP